jgi:hypothetical protein
MPNHKNNSKRNKSKTPGSGLPKFSPFAIHQPGNGQASGIRVGFPAERTVEMAYCDTVAIDITSGVRGTYSFRLNSAFDPNYTASGHQPMGFDQWSSFYNHYVVEGCAWEMVLNSTAASTVPVHALFYLSDDITLPSDIWTFIELGAEYQALTSSVKPASMSGHVQVNKFFNRDAIGADTQLRAAVSADPTEVVFGTVVVAPMDAASSLTIYATVRLTMKVRFMEPKDLTPSSIAKSAQTTIPRLNIKPRTDFPDYEMLYKQTCNYQTPSEHSYRS